MDWAGVPRSPLVPLCKADRSDRSDRCPICEGGAMGEVRMVRRLVNG